MTIHNKIYEAIIQLNTINGTVRIPYRVIGTNIIPFHFDLRGIHP